MISKSAVETTSKSKLVLAGIIALLIAMFALWGCNANTAGAPTEADDQPTAEEAAMMDEIQVTCVVKDDTASDPDFEGYDGTITVLENATVLDVLEETGLPVEQADDGPYGTFVQSIGGLANEGNLGWTYTVNGETIEATAADTVVTGGDEIEWTYGEYNGVQSE